MNKLVYIKKYIPEVILNFTGVNCYDVFPIGDGSCKIVGRYGQYFIDTSPVYENMKKTSLVNIYVKDEENDKYLSLDGFINEIKVMQLNKLSKKL